MESLILEEENIIKDIRNLFILFTAFKDIRNLFKLEKETKPIKDRILKDIENLSEHEKGENYYKPVEVSNFWSNNYIECESDSDTNKTLSVEEYLNKIRPQLKDIIKNLKKSDTWKIQLATANNFISSTDNDEEPVMHSKSDSIEIMINDEAVEVINESMKDSELVFHYVHILHYKCHKTNTNGGGSYIDAPDWIKNKKATINPINKMDNKCFQYSVTVA